MQESQISLDHSIHTLSVIGLGYIGLPTAAMFASTGIEVVGVDVSRHAPCSP
jgi:UDP-N-acetyl-D-mannosaminuronic acid dehydrogenase